MLDFEIVEALKSERKSLRKYLNKPEELWKCLEDLDRIEYAENRIKEINKVLKLHKNKAI